MSVVISYSNPLLATCPFLTSSLISCSLKSMLMSCQSCFVTRFLFPGISMSCYITTFSLPIIVFMLMLNFPRAGCVQKMSQAFILKSPLISSSFTITLSADFIFKALTNFTHTYWPVSVSISDSILFMNTSCTLSSLFTTTSCSIEYATG